jgi:EmrB/QacA subfamily drug resistance transporter
LALVQFIIFLDATIVNVALPSIQNDLQFTSSGLTWVVNGYLLAAGGLLLLGGRLADIFGRRRMFAIGAALFIVASLTAALAESQEVLIIGRFAQGIAEALAAPAAMSLVALLFTDPAERGKAFAIWGGLAGLGSACGVLLSGVLTDIASWRWVFYINIPLAVIPLLLVFRTVDESRMAGARRPDWISAALVTGSMIAIVQGVLSLTTNPFTSAAVLVPLAGGLLALAVFLGIQASSANPLLPLRFLANRTRVTGNLSLMFLNSSTAVMFFLLVLYMQDVLGYSPLENGLAWLPFCVAFVGGLQIAMKLLPRLGTRLTLSAGLLLSGVGILTLTLIPVDGSFVVNLLPGMVLIAVGGGMAFPAIQTAALSGVDMQDAGLGSGILTTVGQLGQAFGLAIIVTLALNQANRLGAAGSQLAEASVGGYRLAFLIAGTSLAIGGVLSYLLLRARPTAAATQAPTPEGAAG